MQAIFDYHTHTHISFDSEAAMPDMLAAARTVGLSELCFTEHVDLSVSDAHPLPEPELFEYDREFERFGKSAGITVKKGLELGPTADNYAKYAPFIAGHEYDFIICSQHFVGDMDPYDGDYFIGKTQREAYSLYLSELLRTLERFADYDVVGHIGYLTKYWRGKEPARLAYAEYAETIDAILRRVIADGKGLELNTSGLSATGDFLPTREILRRYRELGGEIITTGSDAHTPERVGEGIAAATRLLGSLGFKYVCTFEKRRCNFVSIEP